MPNELFATTTSGEYIVDNFYTQGEYWEIYVSNSGYTLDYRNLLTLYQSPEALNSSLNAVNQVDGNDIILFGTGSTETYYGINAAGTTANELFSYTFSGISGYTGLINSINNRDIIEVDTGSSYIFYGTDGTNSASAHTQELFSVETIGGAVWTASLVSSADGQDIIEVAGGLNAFFYRTDGTAAGTYLVCYLRDTHILTPTGEVLIQDLKIGDLVVTASGEERPVKWLGHRSIDCKGHPTPEAVWPVCVKRGAFGDGKPTRDLWVTPGHAFLFDNVLMQAGNLINGVTIVRQPRDRIEIWHVELDSHDIVLAEGVPAETYLDTGNRVSFVNGGEWIELHPDLDLWHSSETCVPLVFEGPALIRTRTSILRAAFALGYRTTAEADVHVMADGNRFEPVWLTETRMAFFLPAASSNIALRSRRFVPLHCQPASNDGRALGIAVRRLQIDGSEVSIDESAALAAGWHAFEDSQRLRWTDGDTSLPSNTRLVVIDLADRGYYWSYGPAEIKSRRKTVHIC